MTWTFTYDAEDEKTTVKWRGHTASYDGKITSQVGGYPKGEESNEAVNSILKSIDISDAIIATVEFRPGMIEYNVVNIDE